MRKYVRALFAVTLLAAFMVASSAARAQVASGSVMVGADAGYLHTSISVNSSPDPTYTNNGYIAGATGGYNLDQWVGLFFEYNYNHVGTESDTNIHANNYGGALRFYLMPKSRFVPYAVFDGGGSTLTASDPSGSESYSGYYIGGGGGLAYYLTKNFGVIAPDIRYNRGSFSIEDVTINPNLLSVSGGVFYQFGGKNAPPPPVTLACSASPESIYPGDPVTVTATAGGLNPKDNVIYSWSGTGVTGKDTTAMVATGSLAAGQYNIQATVKEGKPGKEGLKPWETATCTAGLTVKAFEPPTISCSVSPSTIKPGDTATVTSVGMSPQNRPLTYNYSASAGTVSGSGTTAAYSSAGAPTGTVGITCNVSDDKGQMASSSTSLTITAPYVPPVPHTQTLCSISFATDKKRPMRVDNEAKACLDQVALDLKQQADAKAVVVGEQTSDEAAMTSKQQMAAMKHKHAMVDMFAAQRAVNAKDYLVTEQGIDASRISVATGSTEGQTEENYLVPAGASFSSDVSGTTAVDETAVKPQERKPLPERHPTKKAAAPAQ
jgi:hypothetical protein